MAQVSAAQAHDELRQWLFEGPCVALLDGFSGLGKSDVAATLSASVSDRPRVVLSAADYRGDPDGLMLEILTAFEQQGSPTLSAIYDAGLDDALVQVMGEPCFVVIDDLQELLEAESGIPDAFIVRLITELNRRRGTGRLLLVSSRIPNLGITSQEFKHLTLEPPTETDAEALLSTLLRNEGLEDYVAPEQRQHVVRWLGQNPRAIRSLVACLHVEPLETLVELNPDAWALVDTSSPTLVEHLERAFLERTIGHLDIQTSRLAEALSILRRPTPSEALDALSSPGTPAACRVRLRSYFLLEKRLNLYTLNPIAREILRSRLRGAGGARFRSAHSQAGTYYMAKTLKSLNVNPAQALRDFVEARFHLLNAERAADYQNLAANMRGLLLRVYANRSRMPMSTEEAEVLLQTLGGILDDSLEGFVKLRVLLAKLLLRRNGPGDELLALKQARLATKGSNSTDAWHMLAQLTARNDTPVALEIVGRNALDVLPGTASSSVLPHVVEHLYLLNRTDLALALAQRSLKNLAKLDCRELFTTSAFILAREGRVPEGIALLMEGYRKAGNPAGETLWEEAAFLAFQSRDSSTLVSMSEELKDSPKKAAQLALVECLIHQLSGRYKEAVEVNGGVDYYAVVAQRAFSALAAGMPSRAGDILRECRPIHSPVSWWLTAIIQGALGDKEGMRSHLQKMGLSEYGVSVEAENAWFEVWRHIPPALRPYPAFYFPLLNSTITGLDRTLHAYPSGPAITLLPGEEVALLPPSSDAPESEREVVVPEERPFDIGIITVVKEQTLTVYRDLKARPDFRETVHRRARRWVYEGTIPFVSPSGAAGTLRVAVTQTTEQGNSSAALARDFLRDAYHASVYVILDIAGGVHEDVSLGDVVLATSVTYYEGRAETESGTQRRGKSLSLNAELVNAINRFMMDPQGLLDEVDLESKAGELPAAFSVHSGPIASGEAVIKFRDASVREWLAAWNDKILAVEMEGAGVLTSTWEGGVDDGTYGALVIRGISDHADQAKDDTMRMVACKHAYATFLAMAPILGTVLLPS